MSFYVSEDYSAYNKTNIFINYPKSLFCYVFCYIIHILFPKSISFSTNSISRRLRKKEFQGPENMNF